MEARVDVKVGGTIYTTKKIVYDKIRRPLLKQIKELEKNLEYQSSVCHRMHNELLFYKKKKQNVLFEIKYKRLIDRILKQKKEIEQLKK